MEPTSTGSQEQSISELIESCLPLVKHYAGQMTFAGSPLSYEDAVSEGHIGLVRAARNFRKDGGSSFSTFASIAIKGAILDALRRASPLSRKNRRDVQVLQEVADDLQARTGREATVQELAAAMGLDTERVQEIRDQSRIRVLSLERRLEENSEASAPTAADDIEDLFVQAAEAAEVRYVVEQLPWRERVIIESFFFGGRRHQDVAAEMGISESRVSQIQKRALARLRLMLAEREGLRLAA